MGSMFDFSELIAEYSSPIQIITSKEEKGHYDDNTGEWVLPNQVEQIGTEGVLIPYSERQIYQSGGRLTVYDRQLIINRDIPSKSIVVHNNQKYSVENKIPYSDYANFDQYELKWVNAFG